MPLPDESDIPVKEAPTPKTPKKKKVQINFLNAKNTKNHWNFVQNHQNHVFFNIFFKISTKISSISPTSNIWNFKKKEKSTDLIFKTSSKSLQIWNIFWQREQHFIQISFNFHKKLTISSEGRQEGKSEDWGGRGDVWTGN